jgi:outer membrane autotransporter protein
VAGGIERGSTLGAVGVTLAFTSSDIEDPEAEAQEILSASLVELGLSWRAQGQAWSTWARAAGGYATFDSTRQLVTESVNLINQSSWNGFTLALAGGASYERNFGRLSIRPEAFVEYFSLSEDGHAEEGVNSGFNLEIEDRDGHMFTGVAAVNIGYGFGQDGWIRPEVRVGWRQNFSVDPGETIARFASGGSSFTLSPESIEGGGPIAGFSLSVGNDLGRLSVTADAEMIEDYVRYVLLLRASFRF